MQIDFVQHILLTYYLLIDTATDIVTAVPLFTYFLCCILWLTSFASSYFLELVGINLTSFIASHFFIVETFLSVTARLIMKQFHHFCYVKGKYRSVGCWC